jgi:hypothetical protein
MKTQFKRSPLSPLLCMRQVFTLRSQNGRQAYAQRLILFCIGCRRPNHKYSKLRTYLQIHSYYVLLFFFDLNERIVVYTSSRTKIWDRTEHLECSALLLLVCLNSELKPSGCCRAPCRAFRLRPQLRGADERRHTMHCFSALGVWPPFSLTCISQINQGLVLNHSKC